MNNKKTPCAVCRGSGKCQVCGGHWSTKGCKICWGLRGNCPRCKGTKVDPA